MIRLFIKLLALTLAVAAGRLAYDKVLDLPPFSLKNVIVDGNWSGSQDSLLAITGLEIGKSIYKQDLKYAATKLMQQPGVVQCAVHRGYFRTMTIEIARADAALLVNSGELNALSREGMILPISAGMPALPLVSGRKFTGARCFERLRDPDIAYALELYDALLAASPELSSRLSEINFKGGDALRIFLSPVGTEILINKTDIKNSVQRLTALAKSGMLADTTMLDLRYGAVMLESPLKGGVL